MKKLKFLVGAVVLFALAVVNVWNAATTLRGSELSIADVEALAGPESGGDGTLLEWFDVPNSTWVIAIEYPVDLVQKEDYQVCWDSYKSNCDCKGTIRTVCIEVGHLH